MLVLVLLGVAGMLCCVAVSFVHNDQGLLWLELQYVLHCPSCTLHTALLQPLSQCEQHHQGTRLKPVTKAHGSK